MIDIENEVYTNIKNYITTYYTDASVYVSSIYELVPKSFPACMIEQTDSYVVDSHLDSSGIETTNELVFTITVVTTGDTRKQDAKKLVGIIDAKCFNMGLVRTYSQPIVLQDRNDLYEIVSRYRCIVSSNKTIYRR